MSLNRQRVRAQILRFTTNIDDGGRAQATGTLIYECVASEFQHQKPNTFLLQQGLESKSLAHVLVRPATMVILAGDEFIIDSPDYNPDDGKIWRIMDVTPDPLPKSNRNSKIKLTLERFDRTRTEQT